MINAEPTQEVTPPGDAAQNSPLSWSNDGELPWPRHLPLSIDSIVSSGVRQERELNSYEAGEVGIGPLPKTTRRRGSQIQSISVRLAAFFWSSAFSVAGKYKHSVNKTNTPNCQKVQRPQRSQAMCCSIFGTEIGGLFFFLNLKHFINGPIRVKLMAAAKSCEWSTLGMQLNEGQSCFINHFTLGFSFFKEEERLTETFLVFFIEPV